ncbi:hypothetical protein HNR02_007082 [Amycolatopsis endophytica]|uniref:Uncharacterized protein n=1 Tax=Amycolatopsis endophytica TaxID=860233 RepID=A0A853BGN3_9PSEU|nr:hypothetical protein [Amycolatopsis endophytica]NYI93707.1 hypothetical protein [Amycolatopsis endophytica]
MTEGEVIMPTDDEVEHRIEDVDAPRTARRKAAAQQVNQLAQRRAAIVAQLEDVDGQLGEIVADAEDVISIDELARFTDLKVSDLTQWVAGRKPTRSKRKKATPSKAGTRSRSSSQASGQPGDSAASPVAGTRDLKVAQLT